jgi:hypothetical protein
MQIEYTKLYESSERDAIILTKKNEKIFSLERKIKELERKINELNQSEKGAGTGFSKLRINDSADDEVHIDGQSHHFDEDSAFS